MKRALFFLVVSAIVLGVFVGRVPETTLCYSRALFGIPCPGCGMGRSLVHLAQGRIGESLRFHLFGPIVLGVLATLWGVSLYACRRGRPYRIPNNPAFNGTLCAAMILLLGYWAARLATGTVP